MWRVRRGGISQVGCDAVEGVHVMTDPNVNPNGQVPWQQADANPTEPLNAMTAETGTAANNAPTQAIAAGEQPTQAFTPVERPTQAFTPAEQSTQPLAPVNQPVPPTQALPPVTPAAAPAQIYDARACARTQFALSGGGSGRRIGSSGLRQRQCSGISGRRGRASANAL